MEPWDGPASIAFTDGTVIGAVLDRNGLRPSRYWVTDDGLVVMASEVGVLDIPADEIVAKGRLQPGRMFLVDTAKGRIVDDDEIKSELAARHPYEEWLHAGVVQLRDLPAAEHIVYGHDSVLRRQQLFGYTEEELRILVAPMATAGSEPIGSMGTDTPIAVLSKRPRLLFDYFTQLFAQVTNPPLDAIREELVTCLGRSIGPEGNLLDPTADSCRQILLPFPVIDNDELAKIVGINDDDDMPGFASVTVSGLYDVTGSATKRPCGRVWTRSAVRSTRRSRTAHGSSCCPTATQPDQGADPVAAAHQRRPPPPDPQKTRTMVGLIVECGDVREVHHVALLIGYGAAAVNPYLAFESVEDLIASGDLPDVEPPTAIRNLIKALGKGVLKVMSKMGISTIASYTGAQVFEAIGLAQELVDQYFTGTSSRIEGVGLDVIAAEVVARHARAYPRNPSERAHRGLEVGGEYQWRREGELHLFNPETVFKLQHATRTRRYEIFHDYTRTVDGLSAESGTLRGLFQMRPGVRPPVPIDEVEPVREIVKRFATGAMSYGSISAEAHETLAIAMNRLGGKSNTGEGGEDARRFLPDENGDLRRSAIKQVASGRFGVTSEYLVNADDIQIKMAQGAKPGEGGQLPGHKVYPWIAQTRHSTPGVGLISPPPHHDIYSIEDLEQLIHDLKNANPSARIHVKLVAEVGVGTVAAGVAKAHSDVVLISGHDGGTGAAPLTSLKHAGAPWELGLAETQQTLLLNGLRDRIVVQVDGSMKTGRDVIIGALLGAEEFGFATAPLVVEGCVMMRVCHLDTCPVGVATQNPKLRKRFTGKPEYVVTFFEYVAKEVREYLAALGFRSLDEAVGHAEMLDMREAIDHWKAEGLESDPAAARAGAALRRRLPRHHDAGPRAGPGAGQHPHPALRGRAARRPAGVAGDADPQRQPDRRHDARLGADQALRRRRPARRHDLPALQRVGRAVVRGVRAARDHDDPRRRRQRLPRQGIVRRKDHRLPAEGLDVPRRGQHHRRQRRLLRGDGGRGLRPGAGRGAVLRPQLGRHRRRRGRRRPRLRVHDRRARRHPGPDRAQLRGRDERRLGVPARCRHPADQHRDGRPGGSRRARRGLPRRGRRKPCPAHRVAGRQPAARGMGPGDRALHQGHASRLPAGAPGDPARGSRRPGRQRRDDGLSPRLTAARLGWAPRLNTWSQIPDSYARERHG